MNLQTEALSSAPPISVPSLGGPSSRMCLTLVSESLSSFLQFGPRVLISRDD